MINIEASGSDITYWGRNKDGSLYKVKDENFYPFFYVPDVQGEFVSCFNDERLKKVMCRLPSDVPKERLLYEKHFEGDILYINRYSVDRLGVLEKEPIKVCSIDIETESGSKAVQKFPDVNNPLNRITVIGVHNNFTKTYKIFCLGSKCDFDLCEVEYFDDEVTMLKKFCKYVRTEDFDLFSGYYIDRFDLPYIINRMQKLNMDRTLLSRDSVQSYIDDYGHIHIWGRDTFDIYFGIRSLVSGERPSWKLNDVSQDELGYGKLDYDGELGELFEKDKKKFLEYNYTDVKLVVDLDKKFSMIEFFDEIRRISKCSWSNVFTTNMVNDCHLLQFCKGRYILPSVPKHREKEDYEGAHTEVYGTGLFKDVLMFDYKGLYPTIMMLHNISFETISSSFIDIPVGNGVYFMKKKLGIIPELLYSLFKKRNEYRDLMKKSEYGSDEYKRYKSIQKAYKILMNSRYGDFGYVRSRIYNIKCAEAVTFIGKKIILKTIEVAKTFGLKVLYAHTDSIYFVIDDNVTRTKEELKEIGEKLSGQIENEVRKILPKSTLLPEVTLDLEFKEICLSAFFNEDVKSRNARLVVYDEGEFLKSPRLEITGFQSVRSDTPVLVQKLLNNVFTHILQGDKESDVLKIINDFSTDFINSKFDVRDISIPTSVNAEIPDDIVKGLSYHVKGSVFYNQHFSERTGKIKTGDKVRVCYVKVNSFGIDVISFTDKFPEKLEVDYKKMWERYKSVFLDLFGCMNWHSLSTGSFSLSQFSGKKTQTVNKDTVKTGGLFNFGVKKSV